MRKLFFYTTATIVLLTAASEKGYCQSVMTMTTQKERVEIALSGSDTVTIDWGDDRKSYDYTLSNFTTIFRNDYSDTSVHIITIIGDNVKYINCSEQQIINLDVSKNIALEVLSCYNNQLTNLYISQNTILKELYCFSNQLISLDISKNAMLERLNCNYTKSINNQISRNV
jgi:Leucine-rich repeat (LRR) protein